MFKTLKKNDESGAILLTVILIITIISIITIGIMSLNVGQVTSGQSVIDTVKSEQLALGIFYKFHQDQVSGTNAYWPSYVASEPIGPKSFSFMLNVLPGLGLGDTQNIEVEINCL